jgi:hypothetical protein
VWCEAKRLSQSVDDDFATLKAAVLDPFSYVRRRCAWHCLTRVLKWWRVVPLSLYPLVLQLFPRETYTLDAYRAAVHVLQSHGLWWSGEPHIVPVVDVLTLVPRVERRVAPDSDSGASIAMDAAVGCMWRHRRVATVTNRHFLVVAVHTTQSSRCSVVHLAVCLPLC